MEKDSAQLLIDSETLIRTLKKQELLEIRAFKCPPPILGEVGKIYFALMHGTGFTTDKNYQTSVTKELDCSKVLKQLATKIHKDNEKPKETQRVQIENISDETMSYVEKVIEQHFGTKAKVDKIKTVSMVGDVMFGWAQRVIQAWKLRNEKK